MHLQLLQPNQRCIVFLMDSLQTYFCKCILRIEIIGCIAMIPEDVPEAYFSQKEGNLGNNWSALGELYPLSWN